MGRSGSRKTRQAIFSGNTTILSPGKLDVIDLSEKKSLEFIKLKRQQSLSDQKLIRLKSKFVSNSNISFIALDCLDLSFSDFSNLSGKSFHFGNSDEKWASKMVFVNLSETDISESSFSHCDLRDANLKRSYLTDSDFNQSNLSGANMKEASFNQSRFLNLLPSSLNGDIDSTSFRHASFIKCFRPFSRDQKINFIDFYSACFKDSILEPGADFSDSDFSRSNWQKTSCQSTDFSRTSFQSSIIENSDFSNSDFSDSDIRDINVKNSEFIRTNFKDANLSGAVFVETDFREVEFSYADIKNAVFRKCIFSKSFAKPVFQGSSYKTEKVPDLCEAMNFDQAQFIDCVIENNQ